MNIPLFSILHPSARPQKWREIYETWMASAEHPENVEYVLCVDERWGFREMPYPREPLARTVVALQSVIEEGEFFSQIRTTGVTDFPDYWGKGGGRVVWNTGRRCYVDAVNTAAKASTGSIIIVIADDQYPWERGHWDAQLTHEINTSRVTSPRDFVVSVSTGTPHEHERKIMVMPILSRRRYEREGFVFYPEYESVFADNDFYQSAFRDQCIIAARHLLFPHRHPLAEPGAWEKRGDGNWVNTDPVYAAQNRPAAYVSGEKIFNRRLASGFGAKPLVEKPDPWSSNQANPLRPPKMGGIALALPGEYFHHAWVAKLLEITAGLLRDGWNYCTLLQHTSEPGITRATIVKSISELKGQFDPEFILWMDDDQIVESQQVSMLLNDAAQFPDVDLFAGWTWIASSGPYANEPQVSCGRMNLEKGELSYAEYRSVQSADGVFEVGWTGFPVVLMRTSALEKVGRHPFSHYPCPESPWGECGEDISFCKRLGDAGGRIYVDSRVFVPHMKMKALGPLPASKGEIALALTGATAAD